MINIQPCIYEFDFWHFILIKIGFKWIKPKINKNKIKEACNWSWRSWIISRTSLDHRNLGPFGKNLNLLSISLHALFQKSRTCTTCILLNFKHFEVFLDFLEISRCPLNTLFGFNFIEISMLMYTSLEKDDFLLTFRRTYNVLIHNSQMKHFWLKLVRDKVLENWILFKMSFCGKISDKVYESYAWSKFCWLFIKKP